jgi:predicted metal-dependent phosphoesterase TrpH
MLIDLHTHTSPTSPCSHMTADELIRQAMQSGVDALCVTDHLLACGGREAQAIAQEKYGFPVFRGVEARTTLGDILVFGLDEDIPEWCDGMELLAEVDVRGGAAVLAHPFRHGGGATLWQWMERNGVQSSRDFATRPELVHLHAVETFNGQVTAEELAQAETLASILGLPATGGSDSHITRHVASTVTEFARPIRDEADLVREIRAGRIRPRRWHL